METVKLITEAGGKTRMITVDGRVMALTKAFSLSYQQYQASLRFQNICNPYNRTKDLYPLPQIEFPPRNAPFKMNTVRYAIFGRIVMVALKLLVTVKEILQGVPNHAITQIFFYFSINYYGRWQVQNKSTPR